MQGRRRSFLYFYLFNFRILLLFTVLSVTAITAFQSCGPGFASNSDLLNRSSYGDIPFQPTSGITAVNKVKYLLHGGPVTADELKQATDIDTSRNGTVGEYVQLDQEKLRDLVEGWVDSEAGKKKMLRFLQLNLQQQDFDFISNSMLGRIFPQGPATNDNRNPNHNAWKANIEDAFPRTALDIVYGGRPFTEIITTRKLAVTTGLLTTLAFVDNSQTTGTIRPGSLLLHNVLRAQPASNFNDWRTVTITPASSPTDAADYRQTATLKAVANNANFPLYLPRVGFFNTIAFQLKWETNVDNQFRVTMNQTLAGALNQIFDDRDKTPHGNLSALDNSHAGPGTSCFKCHRLMDPMRETFSLKYNYFYRSSPGTDARTPAFAFRDHTGLANSIDSLANSIATHPDFASAWVQKLCTYANSQPCSTLDVEYLKLVDSFKKSNFNFRKLVIDMYSSPLVTASVETGENGLKANLISSARQFHFCHALDERYRDLFVSSNLTKPTLNLCTANAITSSLKDGISEESIARGNPDIVQSPQMNPLIYRSFEKVCENVAAFVVPATGGPLKTTTESDIDTSIAKIVVSIMGIPTNHPRFYDSAEALRQVYNYSRNAGKQNALLSMRTVFEFACISPDVTGFGL